MSTPAQDFFGSEGVSLEWREGDPEKVVNATCWFERAPIRHVVVKHVNTAEPWNRILDRSLLQRLVQAARGGPPPTATDCRAFVEAVTTKLRASCARPLICRFVETEVPVFANHAQQGLMRSGFNRCEKMMMVLPAGALAFLRVMPSGVVDETSVCFLTAFFPRQAMGWVAPKRAEEATVARYVQRWSARDHHTGGSLLPEPAESVNEIDDATGGAKRWGQFRFISLKAWGFRRQKDGQWVRPW